MYTLKTKGHSSLFFKTKKLVNIELVSKQIGFGIPACIESIFADTALKAVGSEALR